MKSLLAKIAVHKAVGLYLGEHEVAVSKVAATPLGPVEIASSAAPCTAGRLGGGGSSGCSGRCWAAGAACRWRWGCPAPASSSARGRRSAGDAATPEAVLQKALCSSNICVDDLTADLLQGGREQVAGGERGRLPEEIH